MPSKKWSELTGLGIGRYAEYYAKMEFTSYGFEVFTSEIDDHGVDFVAHHPKDKTYFEIQVKSVRDFNYVFIRKDKMSSPSGGYECQLESEPRARLILSHMCSFESEPPKHHSLNNPDGRSPHSYQEYRI